MGNYDRMLGKMPPRGCSVCRVNGAGPDCCDRARSPRVVRKVDARRWKRDLLLTEDLRVT